MIRTICFFLLPLGIAYSQPKWQLRINQDSIKVYTAFTDDSKIKSIRAEFQLRSSRVELFEELMHAERYPEWQYSAVKCEVLEKISPVEMIYYCEASAPWPVSNRDMVIRLRIEEKPGQSDFRVVTLTDSKPVPVRDGLIRVPMSRAEWIVKEISPGKMQIQYNIQIDPGGAVPAWLVNMVAAQAPYQSFKNLKKRLEGSGK